MTEGREKGHGKGQTRWGGVYIRERGERRERRKGEKEEKEKGEKLSGKKGAVRRPKGLEVSGGREEGIVSLKVIAVGGCAETVPSESSRLSR